MPRIYVVEDDEDIRELTIYALEGASFQCIGFESAEDFSRALEQYPAPDLVLLDIMMPQEDGITLLKKLRESGAYRDLPVILLTAKGSEADRVKGLNLGADDYIVKPFGITELIARINAVLRRFRKTSEIDSFIACNQLKLYEDRHKVEVAGEEIPLTFTEFELLKYMIKNNGMVLSREKLMDGVWGYDYVGESRTVDMHIKSLRKKLGTAGDYIKTVRNVGYKIECEV